MREGQTVDAGRAESEHQDAESIFAEFTREREVRALELADAVDGMVHDCASFLDLVRRELFLMKPEIDCPVRGHGPHDVKELQPAEECILLNITVETALNELMTQERPVRR